MTKDNFLQKYLIYIIDLTLLVTSLFSVYYVERHNLFPGYETLYYLPLFYLLAYFLIYRTMIIKKGNLFIYLFLIVTFFRYVILPFLIVKSGLYYGRSTINPTEESFILAIRLMVYELFITFIFIRVILGFKVRNQLTVSNYRSIRIGPVYVFSVLLSILVLIMFPDVRGNFHFLKVSNVTPSESIITMSLTYFVEVNKFILYLILFHLITIKNISFNSKMILVGVLTLLNISIFTGVNRADILMMSIASIVIFLKFFPVKKSWLLILTISLISALALSSVSDFRDHQSFSKNQNEWLDRANRLQVYLGGPYNVAIAIEAQENNEQVIKKSDYPLEVLRSTLGFNLILKDKGIKTSSEYFNERIFFTEQRTQIVPMIGQGYIYFKFLLSPLVILITLLFLRWIIKKRERTLDLSLFYFLTIPIARFSLMMGQNTAILANDTSFVLGGFLMIYILNKKINW